MQSAGLFREVELIAIAKEAYVMEKIMMYKGEEAAALRSQNVWRLLRFIECGPIIY